MKFRSTAKRPFHLGPWPLETLARQDAALPWEGQTAQLGFDWSDDPVSIVNAIRDYQAMMDVLRDGPVAAVPSEVPEDRCERARHLKSFGYFNDAAMVGICRITPDLRIAPMRNPDIDRLAGDLLTKESNTLSTGIDTILAELREALAAPDTGAEAHTHAIVYLYPQARAPRTDEPGTDWIRDAEPHRAAFRATETACVIANYLRLLGHPARAHSASTSDIDLGRAALRAGLAMPEGARLIAPYFGPRWAVAAVTTTLEMEADRPLAAQVLPSKDRTDPYRKRLYARGPHPFERLKRVDQPTTYIDEPNVPRVPKRADLFARAQFGDMGPALQAAAKAGHYVRKSATSYAQRRLLSALSLIQNGAPSDGPRPQDAAKNAENIRATSYFLGLDAVGTSRCPDWAWYSHDAGGHEIDPSHPHAVSMIVDQGFETMEGASGDDWISVAQSMRAYLRFSLLGGVMARQLRNLGYAAKAHTAIDGDVLQPPLLLLAGLGEVSRIGEVILNPFLGPRLKSGVVTTDMPMDHDKPIDFGLQAFCNACNKCARECPSGAITAGPKKMFNGYEIWKSDSQRCATYRLTTEGGAMCGRCMKTCPWNLEGLFAEAPFRWAASNIPAAAPWLAKLDDKLGRGGLNPVKKWWWDLGLEVDGAYHPAKAPVNARGLQPELVIDPAEQTLAVYPAPLTPPPWPYPHPMDREAGIQAYQSLISAEEHRQRTAAGEMAHLHRTRPAEEAPVIETRVTKVVQETPGITRYTLQRPDGGDMPAWTAGAHVDVVVAPEYLRQYSLTGDPARRDAYEIAVLREDSGRGGSLLMHRIFAEGRRVFLSHPENHFPLVEDAPFSFLMAGGIGITPMIPFAHRLHALGRDFALHYSVPSRSAAACLSDLAQAPWSDKVRLHVTEEGTRADFETVLAQNVPGPQLYTCGPDRYMDAVLTAARAARMPDEALHREYFSVPDAPERENFPFRLRLNDGTEIAVPADRSAAEALIDAGFPVDLKCSDGLCGVCKCGLRGGDVDHRDYVLSAKQRETALILCRSRAVDPDGIMEIDF
ncbi:4Fe-4S dicluster domain-containing protein [Mesobacterium pallidum]|uniref:4Fe-4S dicluster domain-containing protein n=1 Tax=Mesobacterium pallidum TaxID=2872037 RepID=UPI001EE248C6|nr:4Fe-4S dicluster domain-containing protein [Mesobacterium pallidum]